MSSVCISVALYGRIAPSMTSTAEDFRSLAILISSQLASAAHGRKTQSAISFG